jgi:hypothetical protein
MSGLLAAVSQRPFWNETQIKEFVQQKKAEVRALFSGTENADSAVRSNNMRAKLILNTEKERTWLVADQGRVDWVLDDRRRETPRLRLTKQPKDALPVNAGEDYSEDVGTLTFGDMPQKWGYSKELFAPETAEEVVSQFLLSSDGRVYHPSTP